MPSPQYNPRRQHKPTEKKPKRSGASPSRGDAINVPWWIWLAGGVAVGVFVSFLLKLSHVPQPAAVVPVEQAQVKAIDKKSAAVDSAKADDKSTDKTAPDDTKTVTKFDFYTLLPEREVIVPNEREAIKAVDKQKPQAGQAAAPESVEQLLLQVGSFRSAQEAERRRAQITALNLDAKIESVRANGDTWYRVQAGPFTSRDQLTKARDQLSVAGIESLLLKQKP
jgi:cell division protein FtsN